jgi:hypothetical protein
MRNPLWEWWKAALSASEIAWYSPQVVHKRARRLLAAPTLTRAGDRKEATRMVAEKLQAGQEAQWALWQQSLAMQQRMWADLWSAAMTGRSPQASLQRAGRRGLLDTAVLAQRTLAPVRSRVKANARRLGARR